jgi:hypothetical protein
MPRKSKKKVIGFGLLDSLKSGIKSINDKLKSSKLVSRSLKTLGTAGNVPIVGSYIAPYQSSLLKAGQIAEDFGYGKMKKGRKIKIMY